MTLGEGVSRATANRSRWTFLHLVVAGQITEAYRKYVDMQGTHHSPFFRAGFPALQEAMAADHTKFPGKRITVRNVLGDGQFVAIPFPA